MQAPFSAAPSGSICRGTQQVKFADKQRPSLAQHVSMEVLQRYPGSLLLQLAQVEAEHADPSVSILEVNIECPDPEALAMAIHVHRTGSVFGGPLPCRLAADPQTLLSWLDVLGRFNLPPLHELDIAVGEATPGSLQLLLKTYQAAAVESVVQTVLKLLPKGPSMSILLRQSGRTAFAIVPEQPQADSPFRLAVFRLDVDYPAARDYLYESSSPLHYLYVRLICDLYTCHAVNLPSQSARSPQLVGNSMHVHHQFIMHALCINYCSACKLSVQGHAHPACSPLHHGARPGAHAPTTYRKLPIKATLSTALPATPKSIHTVLWTAQVCVARVQCTTFHKVRVYNKRGPEGFLEWRVVLHTKYSEES